MTNCLNTTKLEKKLRLLFIHMIKPADPILYQKPKKDYEDLINKFGNITGAYALLNTHLIFMDTQL